LLVLVAPLGIVVVVNIGLGSITEPRHEAALSGVVDISFSVRSDTRITDSLVFMRMATSRLSTRDYEDLQRRIDQQDRNVTPKLGPKRSSVSSMSNAEVKRLRQQLLAFARSF
jgi:hypothetical protein